MARLDIAELDTLAQSQLTPDRGHVIVSMSVMRSSVNCKQKEKKETILRLLAGLL